MRSILILFILALGLGMGTFHAGLGSSMRAPSSSRSDPSLAFHYDPVRHACLDAQGKHGFNAGVLDECGLIRGEWLKFHHKDFSGKSLRGLMVTNSFLAGSIFDGADLTDAFFERSILTDASFVGASLYGAYFGIAPQDFKHASGGFRNARINSRTRLGKSLAELIAEGIRIDGEENHGSWQFRDLHGKTLEFALDDRFNPQEQAIVAGDLSLLLSIELGGGEDIAAFLADRVRALLRVADEGRQGITFVPARNASASYWNQLRLNRLVDLINERLLPVFNWNIESFNQGSDSPAPNLAEDPIESARLMMNGRAVPVSSPRAGIIEIAPPYFTMLDRSSLSRAASLVHEARHSDCDRSEQYEARRSGLERKVRDLISRLLQQPHAQSRADWASVLEAARAEMAEATRELKRLQTEFHEDDLCGYPHIDCPSDHPDPVFRGMKASCDPTPEGAYGTQARFLGRVAKSCMNCTEIERQEALTSAASAMSRVIRLKPEGAR